MIVKLLFYGYFKQSVIVFILLIYLEFTSAQKVSNRECVGTNYGLSSSTNNYKNLETTFKNCRYIKGNLEISNFDPYFNITNANYGKLDDEYGFSFLENITEITGYLIVHNTKIKNLRLPNLKVIGGISPYRGKYTILINKNSRLESLQFGNLREILNGSVLIRDNHKLCHVDQINWNDLIGGNATFDVGDNQDRSNCKKCSESCCQTDNYAQPPNKICPCWSPNQCQALTKVTCDKRCDNRCYNGGCCHEQCAGGCTGPTQKDCTACRRFRIFDTGECVESCPDLHDHDPTTGALILNPSGMYKDGMTCVRKCPANLYIYQDSCVLICPAGTYQYEESVNDTNSNEKVEVKQRVCKQCPTEMCPKTCQLNSPYINKIEFDKNYHVLKNCEIFNGDLLILEETYEGPTSRTDKKPQMTDQDLEVFSSIRVVNGYVRVQGNRFNNLSFLRNLEVIRPNKLESNKYSFVVVGKSIKTLGLRNLKSIEKGDVRLYKTPSLCIGTDETINWPRILHPNNTIEINITLDRDSCKNEGYVCDEECNGCWSTGPTECQYCKNYRIENRCIQKCDGYSIDNKFLYLANNQTRECKYCHAECVEACTGPTEYDCLKCANFEILESDGKKKCVPAGKKIPYDILMIVIGASILILVVAGLTILWQRFLNTKRKFNKLEQRHEEEDEDFQQSYEQINTSMSTLLVIPNNQLKQKQMLGKGAFGEVYRGECTSSENSNVKIDVAIKQLPLSCANNEEKLKLEKDIIDEATVMASVNHQYCAKLIGICIVSPIRIVFKLVQYGSVVQFFKKHRDQVTEKMLLKWSYQIAEGMEYLESKAIVHRDLAARNILVKSFEHIKITDFGLAKILHANEKYVHVEKNSLLPVKWMAIESIQNQQFDHKSDVWSYGVCLWEIFTFCSTPWQEIKTTRDLFDKLQSGSRLAQPQMVDSEVYIMMIKCWIEIPSSRPTFEELKVTFKRFAETPHKYLSKKNAMSSKKCQSFDENSKMNYEVSSDLNKLPKKVNDVKLAADCSETNMKSNFKQSLNVLLSDRNSPKRSNYSSWSNYPDNLSSPQTPNSPFIDDQNRLLLRRDSSGNGSSINSVTFANKKSMRDDSKTHYLEPIKMREIGQQPIIPHRNGDIDDQNRLLLRRDSSGNGSSINSVTFTNKQSMRDDSKTHYMEPIKMREIDQQPIILHRNGDIVAPIKNPAKNRAFSNKKPLQSKTKDNYYKNDQFSLAMEVS